MYPTSNANNNNTYVQQQVAAQPMYQPAPYAPNVSSQPRVDNSQVFNQQASLDAPQPIPPPQYCGWSQSTYNGYPQGIANPLIRQPMMHSLSRGAQYLPVYQYTPQQQMPMNMGYSNAPIYNGQSATALNQPAQPVESSPVPADQPQSSSVREKQLTTFEKLHEEWNASLVISSDKPALEKLPKKTREFLRALDEAQRAKSSSSEVAKSSAEADLGEDTDSSSVQKHFEQHMSVQKQILEALQPKPFPRCSLFDAPESYKIAMSRLEAMKPNAPQMAQKTASMVFIYDIDDITQLSTKIISEVKRMFPDLRTTAKIIRNLSFWFSGKFFECSKDQDFNMTVMNVKDGHFGTKINDYLELKNKCEANGSNVVYELIQAYADEKAREEEARNTQKKTNLSVSLAQVIQFQALFEQPWQSAKKCLQAISDKSLKNTYDNVVLCSLIGCGVSELMISGLASDVPLENIYSTARSSKEEVLERIQRDYGENCTLVFVTSDDNAVAAAEKQNILVWPIEDAKSLDALHAAQKFHLLK